MSLGNFIGKFLEYDESNRGAAWKPYMKIRVELNVDHPLKRWKKIKMSNGLTTQMDFRYERLYIFCFIFEKLGHLERFCDASYAMTGEVSNKEWGVFLKALDRRTYATGESKWLKLETRGETVGKSQ